MQQYERVE